MSISGPARKVCLYLLLVLLLAVTLRIVNHAWPSVALLGIVGGMSYYIWRKEQALAQRIRKADQDDSHC